VKGKEEMARKLMSFLTHRAAKAGYHIVQLAVGESDVVVLPPLPRISIRLQIYCGSFRHDVKRLAGQTVYEDICLV
jgi:hypothetical protein